MAEQLFVYGKLRKGLEYHQEYLAGSEFLGVEQLSGYRMFVNPQDNYPHVLKRSGRVLGEIYTVAPEQISRIDMFQRVPMEFEREKVRVGEFDAWIYVYAHEHQHEHVEVPDGDWKTYGQLKKQEVEKEEEEVDMGGLFG